MGGGAWWATKTTNKTRFTGQYQTLAAKAMRELGDEAKVR
jgi:hypothetical protein